MYMQLGFSRKRDDFAYGKETMYEYVHVGAVDAGCK
jgi:hypothetical protein